MGGGEERKREATHPRHHMCTSPIHHHLMEKKEPTHMGSRPGKHSVPSSTTQIPHEFPSIPLLKHTVRQGRPGGYVSSTLDGWEGRSPGLGVVEQARGRPDQPFTIPGRRDRRERR